MNNPIFKINSRGEWYYNNSIISRNSLVKLFSSILTRYKDGTFHLKTPVEDVLIEIEDVPFIIIDLKIKYEDCQIIYFETNVGDIIKLGKHNPLWMEKKNRDKQLLPYVLVKAGIGAKISRSVYYNLAEVVIKKNIDDNIRNVIESDNCFFDIDIAKDRKEFIG